MRFLKMCLLALFAVTFTITANAQEKKELRLIDQFINIDVYPKRLSQLQWVGKSDAYSYISVAGLVKGYVNKRQANDTLLTSEILNKALEDAGLEKTRRFPAINWINENSFYFVNKHQLVVYDLKSGKANLKYAYPEEGENMEIAPELLHLAYTIEDDLYIRFGEESIRVTEDGGNGIVNGQTVHRSEFGISDGIFWSPKGNLLAFYRKDESMVTEYPLVNTNARVAEVKSIRYPMAGMTSEEVKVGVYNPITKSTVWLETGNPVNTYYTNVTWTPDEKYIYIAVLNRGQDHMKLNKYSAENGKFIATLFEEKSDRYVEPEHGPIFLDEQGLRFIWFSERDKWNHLYLYNDKGELIKQLTKGEWAVKEFMGFDDDKDEFYFTSTAASPLETQLFKYTFKKDKIERITTVRGTHNCQVSASGDYVLDSYSNYDEITAKVDLITENGKIRKVLLENVNVLDSFNMGRMIMGTLKADDNTELYYRMILPPDFDENKKYPVYYYLYGGPHAQLVSDAFLGGSGYFLQYMAAQGYIVFTLDNRGSANRGYEFESIIHRQLGQLEVSDQMKGVEFLKSLPYVDQDRMGIQGWSYGGFMTISMMLKNPDVFKVGIAGGPVIDWKYYEVMYGERYMDTPEENPEGYKNANLVNSVDNLNGRLMIVHGTMDPVVVWQHSLVFIESAISKRKNIDYFVYPGHEHNVGGMDRLHLFEKFEQYMKDHL
jgi:dipeptidyl-peptidase-4